MQKYCYVNYIFGLKILTLSLQGVNPCLTISSSQFSLLSFFLFLVCSLPCNCCFLQNYVEQHISKEKQHISINLVTFFKKLFSNIVERGQIQNLDLFGFGNFSVCTFICFKSM